MQGQKLDDHAFATVQGALDRLSDEAIALGLTVRIETDLDDFASLRRAVGDGGLYPSFDPALSQLTRDAFWLRVSDVEGELVAILAARVFRCADFMALLRSERVWFDRGLRLVSSRYNLLATRFDDAVWGGVVGHGGGLGGNPRMRGHGLTTGLPFSKRGASS